MIEDYLKFMKMADMQASNSIDPTRKVGSVLVSESGVVYGSGYNNFPSWFDLTSLPNLSKYEKSNIIIHAEVSCLNNSVYVPFNMTMFITSVPCLNCVISICNSKFNIKEIIYKYNNLSDGYYERHRIQESLDYLKDKGIIVRCFDIEGDCFI